MSPAVLLQYLLPHRLLSAGARALAYSRFPPLKNWLIRLVVGRFKVDVDEAAEPRLDAYPSFNAFFTRALKPGARLADPDPHTLLQPADGTMSQCGRIESGLRAAQEVHTAA